MADSKTVKVSCGRELKVYGGARFRKCDEGHVHCIICGREARHIGFGKGLTCGFNCKPNVV